MLRFKPTHSGRRRTVGLKVAWLCSEAQSDSSLPSLGSCFSRQLREEPGSVCSRSENNPGGGPGASVVVCCSSTSIQVICGQQLQQGCCCQRQLYTVKNDLLRGTTKGSFTYLFIACQSNRTDKQMLCFVVKPSTYLFKNKYNRHSK